MMESKKHFKIYMYIGYVIICYLKLKQIIIDKILNPFFKFLKNNLSYVSCIIIIVVITTAATQKDNILKFINSTSEFFSIQLYNNYNEIEENSTITSTDKNFKVYYDFESLEKDLKIKILKPSYIPLGYEMEDISVIHDTSVNFRIVTRYIDRINKTQEKNLVYSIYVAKDNNSASKMIQEKKKDIEILNYKTDNKALKNCYFFYNIDWLVCIFEDGDNNGNTKYLYEIYGLNSEEEMKKIMDGVN